MIKKREKIEGLGDLIATITNFFFIDKLVTFVFNILDEDCGCERRREKLNKSVPFKK